MISAGAGLIIAGFCLLVTMPPLYSDSRDPGAWLITTGIVLVLMGVWCASGGA